VLSHSARNGGVDFVIGIGFNSLSPPNKHFVADRMKLGFMRKAWFLLVLSFGG
jgi:hypothetical protein